MISSFIRLYNGIVLIISIQTFKLMDKVTYLQKQNVELRSQIAELNQMVKINKTQIDILSSQLDDRPEAKKFMDIIYKNRQKQDKLQQRLTTVHQQVKQLMTENFMLKQLNEEQSHQIKALSLLNLDSINQLQAKIKQLEDKIVSYEKIHKQYDKVSGFVLKNRNIVSPIDISLQMKEREAQINNQLEIMVQQVEDARKKEENLMIVNTVLRNKIVSLQVKLAMPNKNLGQVLDRSLKRLMLYFLQVQKKIITGDQDSDSDQEDDIQLIAPELSGLFPEKNLRIQKDYGVPHLDLLKIREQITQGNQKIKDALAARNHLSDKERLQRLEIELEYTRRELSKNIIEIKNEKDKRKKAQRYLKQAEARNSFLINSNTQLETKVRKYWERIQKLLLEKQTGTSQQQQNHDVQGTLAIQQNLRKSKKPLQGFKLEVNEPLDYKIYLEIMARQLGEDSKIKNLKKLKRKNTIKNIEQKPRLRRTTSNPFLYFNERKNEIMDINNEDPTKRDERFRLEQTYYDRVEDGRFQEDLDGYDI